MTVRTDAYPYYQWLNNTYRRCTAEELADRINRGYRWPPGRLIPSMIWDDFALFEPKPWKMQPGDLGL